MKPENDPITDDEWLLRRVWRDLFLTQKVPVISPSALKPRYKGRDLDKDGISLYRGACLVDPADILAKVADEKRSFTGIVRLSVSFFKSLGLTVTNKPAQDIKGHVVIPELNSDDYKAAPGKFTPILKALADEASKDENIVRRPSPNP